MFLSAEKIQHGPKSGYFSRKNSTWPKKWFFQQKKFNMAPKVVISAEKIQHGPKSGSFSRKNSTCAENVLLSAEMLNMLNHVVCSAQKKRFFLLKC